MSDIAPISRPTFTGINGQGRPAGPTSGADTAPSRHGDRVELSTAATFLGKLKALPPIREDLVASIRAQIEAGTYETEERLTGAVEALSEDLA